MADEISVSQRRGLWWGVGSEVRRGGGGGIEGGGGRRKRDGFWQQTAQV